MSTFKEKISNFGREIFLFLSSKIFLKNLAGMIGAIALLLLVSFFWMSSYTLTKFQAEEKLLPTLAGNDNYNYYARRLKQLKVNLKVRSKQFSNKLEENTILYLYVNDKKIRANDLKAGVKVPQGAMVEAVITTRGGARVAVPNLVCKKYSEAEFLIGGSQLSISVIKDGTVKSLEDAYVWKQSPTASGGKTLTVGSTIDVYVQKRPPSDCN